MVEATVVSAGAYDPTVPGHRPDETPWFEAVALDPDGAIVQADRRLCFDPGGIGKGLAADLVVADTMAAGASAVAIFLGGDGRVSSDDGLRRWAIEVAAPDGTTSIDRLELGDGAVATSGCRRAHLVDPVTGRIVEPGEVVQVSVLAGTGATAEALTKAVLLGGDPHVVDRLDRSGHRCAGAAGRRPDDCQRDLGRPSRRVSGRGRGVNDQLWWYLARSAGMAAAVLMVGALVLGILAATRALKDIDRPAWLVALHRWFSVLTVIAVVTHLGRPRRRQLCALRPRRAARARARRRGGRSPSSLGVIALYLFAVVHVSSLAMKRLPKVWWRRLHTLSYLSVWAAMLHAGSAGTDTTNVVYRSVATLLTMAAVAAVLFRVVLGRYAARVSAGRRPSGAEAEGAERRRPRPARRVDEVEVVVAGDVHDADGAGAAAGGDRVGGRYDIVVAAADDGEGDAVGEPGGGNGVPLGDVIWPAAEEVADGTVADSVALGGRQGGDRGEPNGETRRDERIAALRARRQQLPRSGPQRQVPAGRMTDDGDVVDVESLVGADGGE